MALALLAVLAADAVLTGPGCQGTGAATGDVGSTGYTCETCLGAWIEIPGLGEMCMVCVQEVLPDQVLLGWDFVRANPSTPAGFPGETFTCLEGVPFSSPSAPPPSLPGSPMPPGPPEPLAGVLFSSPSAPPSGGEAAGGSDGDPHLYFAKGGTADFRGKNGTTYALLTAPGVHFAGVTEDSSFLLPRPQLVHGSFWKHAEWVVRGISGALYGITTSAREVGFKVYNISHHTPKLTQKYSGVWKQWWSDGIRVYYKQATIYVRAGGWEMNATRHPIYLPVDNGSPWRFDIAIRKLDDTVFSLLHGAASATCFPHGILGQSWDGDNIAVSGATDDYTFNISHPVVATKSMADGAIEGVAEMYEVPSLTPGFTFSRFEQNTTSHCDPRNVSKLTGIKTIASGKSNAASTGEF